MDKNLKEECMKYVYADLARINQSRKLPEGTALENEIAFERLLDVVWSKMKPSWKDIYRMIKNKLRVEKVKEETKVKYNY